MLIFICLQSKLSPRSINKNAVNTDLTKMGTYLLMIGLVKFSRQSVQDTARPAGSHGFRKHRGLAEFMITAWTKYCLLEARLRELRRLWHHSHDDFLNTIEAELKVSEKKLCRMAFLFRTKKFDSVTPASELLMQVSTQPRSQKVRWP